jgi:hypothetical protein
LKWIFHHRTQAFIWRHINRGRWMLFTCDEFLKLWNSHTQKQTHSKKEELNCWSISIKHSMMSTWLKIDTEFLFEFSIFILSQKENVFWGRGKIWIFFWSIKNVLLMKSFELHPEKNPLSLKVSKSFPECSWKMDTGSVP